MAAAKGAVGRYTLRPKHLHGHRRAGCRRGPRVTGGCGCHRSEGAAAAARLALATALLATTLFATAVSVGLGVLAGCGAVAVIEGAAGTGRERRWPAGTGRKADDAHVARLREGEARALAPQLLMRRRARRAVRHGPFAAAIGAVAIAHLQMHGGPRA